MPLATGLRIIAAPRSLLLEDLPHYIKCLRVSHIGLVPSLIEATMVAVEDDPETFPLRYICSGGEKMSDTVCRTFVEFHLRHTYCYPDPR